jgi:hypothetical protein
MDGLQRLLSLMAASTPAAAVIIYWETFMKPGFLKSGMGPRTGDLEKMRLKSISEVHLSMAVTVTVVSITQQT